jgi:hypothetical protein
MCKTPVWHSFERYQGPISILMKKTIALNILIILAYYVTMILILF